MQRVAKACGCRAGGAGCSADGLALRASLNRVEAVCPESGGWHCSEGCVCPVCLGRERGYFWGLPTKPTCTKRSVLAVPSSSAVLAIARQQGALLEHRCACVMAECWLHVPTMCPTNHGPALPVTAFFQRTTFARVPVTGNKRACPRSRGQQAACHWDPVVSESSTLTGQTLNAPGSQLGNLAHRIARVGGQSAHPVPRPPRVPSNPGPALAPCCPNCPGGEQLRRGTEATVCAALGGTRQAAARPPHLPGSSVLSSPNCRAG